MTDDKNNPSQAAIDDNEDEDDEEAGSSDESYDTEKETPAFRPIQGLKSWLFLGAIFVVIAIAVLYVYQAGDNKTILGNQPIPVDQNSAFVSPVALNVQGGATVQNIQPANPPYASNLRARSPQPPTALPSYPTAAKQPTANKNTVQCNHCGTTGLPVCASCGAVMQPLTQDANGTVIYACPVCGSVGVPICPACGAYMGQPGPAQVQPSQAINQPTASRAPNTMVGQFQCPVCSATGLPNFDPQGIAHCPICNAPMAVR